MWNVGTTNKNGACHPMDGGPAFEGCNTLLHGVRPPGVKPRERTMRRDVPCMSTHLECVGRHPADAHVENTSQRPVVAIPNTSDCLFTYSEYILHDGDRQVQPALAPQLFCSENARALVNPIHR